MDKSIHEVSGSIPAEESPITANDYQEPTIEVYNPNQLTESANQIMTESSGGYYS